MESMQSWCRMVCAGIVFCGIVMILVPSQRYRKIMQMVLGIFLLLCILSLRGIAGISISPDMEAVEKERQEASGAATNYFLDRVLEQSEKEVKAATYEYLSEYGIKEDAYKIYMGKETDAGGEAVPYVLLTLPEELHPYQQTIYKALHYQLGIDVRIEYRK